MIILSPTGKGMAFFEFFVGKGLSTLGVPETLLPYGSTLFWSRSGRKTNTEQEHRPNRNIKEMQ